MENLEEIVFTIVGFSGECRGLAYEALELSQNGKFDEAVAKIKEAEKALYKAHNLQTDLIQKEASGEHISISMIFVHAQDHLMTAFSEKELIKKMIDTNKHIYQLEERIKILENK